MEHSRRSAGRIALLGVLSALSVVLLFLGGAVPGAFYAGPAAAGLLTGIIREEYDWKNGLLSFAAVAVLSFILTENKRVVLLYLLLIGYYPLVKPLLDRIPAPPLRVLAKLALCDVTLFGFYYTTFRLILGGAENPAGLHTAPWLTLLLFVVAGDLAFLIYDYAVGKLLRLYAQRLRPFLRRRGK